MVYQQSTQLVSTGRHFLRMIAQVRDVALV